MFSSYISRRTGLFFMLCTLGISAWAQRPKKQLSDIPSEQEFGNVTGNLTTGSKVEYYSLADALLAPETVTSLKLNSQGLTDIPDGIRKMVNLTELDLSDNSIDDFSGKLNGLN